jgi:RNA polymerase sigma factor (sigma-70 family)
LVALGERSTPNGQELLAEFIQYGHQKPFEEIVRRYAGMVFNVCYRITKDKHEAEDATQAVFLTLALQAKRGADIKALGPWLQQVAKRLSLDTRRSKKRRATREERHHVEQTIRRESLLDDTLPSADLDELKTILHEELQKLPAKYRMPLILHYFGGLTRDEMAAELNCKPSTLGVRIFRGREMLAGRLSSRGINISVGMLAVVMGYVVKRAISDTLIRSTSYAATAMFAGHDGAGFASAHVIGLTRRATGALVIGKVRIAAITLMLAGTSLGAGAKAMGILPKIDIQQIITNQLMRMVRPLLSPFNQPLRVDSQTVKTNATVAAAPSATPAAEIQPVVVISQTTQIKPVVKPVLATDTNTAKTEVAAVATPTKPAWITPASYGRSSQPSSAVASSTSAATSAKTADDSDVTASASGAGGGGGSGAISDYHSSTPLPSRSTASSFFSAYDQVLATNNLYVGSSSGSQSTGHLSDSSTTSTNPSASPAAMIAVPAVGGTVTESSAGELRGWGIIDRTGILQINGRVVADGQGVDRTLNLTTFTSVQTPVSTITSAVNTVSASTYAASAPVISAVSASDPSVASVTSATKLLSNPPAASAGSTSFAQNASAMPDAPVPSPTQGISTQLYGNGWYAINHGRLALPLIPSSTDPTTLTWGDNPDSSTLSLVNSVRVALMTDPATGQTADAPNSISLLSTDRTDVPDMSQMNGVAIGLWQVDPKGSDIAAADLTVCYNAFLADELGAAPSSLQLWTYSDTSDSWQSVAPSSYSLDTADNTVSGYATDISYFAVSVDPAIGDNVNDLLASHLSQFSGEPTPGGGSAHSVPEPMIGLPLLIAGTALLGRRRRRSHS